MIENNRQWLTINAIVPQNGVHVNGKTGVVLVMTALAIVLVSVLGMVAMESHYRRGGRQ